MANIPVERTGGTPWWLWLLGLLLLALLIWFLIGLFDDDEVEVATVDDVGVVDTPTGMDDMDGATDAGAISSLAELASGTVNVGRPVDLDNMRVLTLTGDSSLFVGPSQDPEQGVLIVLQGMNESESLSPPPTGRDGEFNIDEGEVISLRGVVAAFDETVPDYAEMPAADRDRVQRDGVYINANSIDVLEEVGTE